MITKEGHYLCRSVDSRVISLSFQVREQSFLHPLLWAWKFHHCIGEYRSVFCGRHVLRRHD